MVPGRTWLRDKLIKAIVLQAISISPRVARGVSITIMDTNTTPSPVHHCLDVHGLQLLRKGPVLFVLLATTQNWSHHGQFPRKQEHCIRNVCD